MGSQSVTDSGLTEKKPLRAQWLAADDALRETISRFATQSRFEDEFFDAMFTFWGVEDPEEVPVELEGESPEFLLAFEWYLYDHRESQSGKRMIELFAEVEAKRLPPLECQLLSMWVDAVLDLYEVVSVEQGVGYLVRCLLDGREQPVEDAPTSEELKPGDLLVARLLPVGTAMRPSSVFRTFSPSDLPRLNAMLQGYFSDFLAQHPEADWVAFLREQGYLFNDYALERQALAERLAEVQESPPTPECVVHDSGEQYAEVAAAPFKRLEEQYWHWLDRPSPALWGGTPRQAALSASRRDAVIKLLREMGEIEASYALVGEPAFEVASLLPELKLDVDDLQ